MDSWRIVLVGQPICSGREGSKLIVGWLSEKTSVCYSCDALEIFLKRNNLSHVIRAHEVKQAGFQVSLREGI